jgi:hypothetical protein
LRAAFRGCGFALIHSGGDQRYDLLRFVCLRRGIPYAFKDVALAIDVGGTQIRPAEIDGANQITFCGETTVHALRFSSAKHIETNRGNQYSAFDNVLRPTFDI